MRESSKIMADILQAPLPVKFQQKITQQAQNLRQSIAHQLDQSLSHLLQVTHDLELDCGTEAFDQCQTTLNLLGDQFVLEPDLSAFERVSKKTLSQRGVSRLRSSHHHVRKSFNVDSFAEDMEDEQVILNYDSQPDEQAEAGFSLQAIQRQVNYTSQVSVDVDFLSFERLSKLYDQAKTLGIMKSGLK